MLIFLILALAAAPFSSSAETVLDISGFDVIPGEEYYVLPVIRGSGGGLTADSKASEICPLRYVVQEPLEVSDGLPVIFSPVDPNQPTVRVSTDLNVEFSAFTICVQSLLWKLSSFDEETRRWFVSFGGTKGNPGPQTISNWFKIEKNGERDYNFLFCPTVCETCRVVCGNMGVFISEDGQRRLALSEQPFKVMFKKATTTTEKHQASRSSPGGGSKHEII